MRLVFDTSALRNVALQDTVALTEALASCGAEVWVPASVVFELRRQAQVGLARAMNALLLGDRPPTMSWVDEAWRRGRLGGSVLTFTEETATGLADWAFSYGDVRFAKAKLWKAFLDSKPLHHDAVDHIWNQRMWPPKGPVGLVAFKDHFFRAAEDVLRRYDDVPRVSATIDWLHLGAALEQRARLVSDDEGVEFSDPCVVRSRALFVELSLHWAGA